MLRALTVLSLLAAPFVGCGDGPTKPDDDDATLPAAPVLVTPAGGTQLTTDMPTFTVQNARRFNGSASALTNSTCNVPPSSTVVPADVPSELLF